VLRPDEDGGAAFSGDIRCYDDDGERSVAEGSASIYGGRAAAAGARPSSPPTSWFVVRGVRGASRKVPRHDGLRPRPTRRDRKKNNPAQLVTGLQPRLRRSPDARMAEPYDAGAARWIGTEHRLRPRWGSELIGLRSIRRAVHRRVARRLHAVVTLHRARAELAFIAGDGALPATATTGGRPGAVLTSKAGELDDGADELVRAGPGSNQLSTCERPWVERVVRRLATCWTGGADRCNALTRALRRPPSENIYRATPPQGC